MRFILTSDWHLGRAFYNVSLLEDQAYVLDQLLTNSFGMSNKGKTLT